jgi:hypothetical protein
MGAAAGLAVLLAVGALGAQPQAPPKPAPIARAAAKQKPLSATLTGPAKDAYEAGKLLFLDKDYANALIKFRRAYELSSDPRLLWNVAVCEKNLRRYTRMLNTIDALLKDESPLLTEADRKEAADLAQTAQAFVSPLKLTVSEGSATVFIDDEEVGSTPLEKPVLLDVGTRKIRITKPGFKEVVRSEEVAGGSDVVIDVKLEKEVHEGRLRIVAGPKDSIVLDGKVVGVGRYEGVVPSGDHALRVTAPGMADYKADVHVQDDKLRELRVSLTPLPASGGSLTWLWIAGGAVLVAGAVVGGVFLFQPTQEPAVKGTLPPGTVQLSFGGM